SRRWWTLAAVSFGLRQRGSVARHATQFLLGSSAVPTMTVPSAEIPFAEERIQPFSPVAPAFTSADCRSSMPRVVDQRKAGLETEEPVVSDGPTAAGPWSA